MTLIRKTMLSLCVLAGSSAAAWAGPVSLDAVQVPVLRQVVAQDAEAADQYGRVRKLANEALNDAPHPIAVVVGEGRLDSDPQMIASTAALKDFPKIQALAWVWLVGQDAKYAEKDKEFILAWARVNRSDGDPINETKFEPLIVAYDIVRSRFAPAERSMVDDWLRERAVTLWNDPRHRTENWQSHRLKIVGMIATVIQDNDLWKNVENGYKKQIDSSFLPDGAAIDFGLRDAMHYHLYSVLPLLTLACVAHQRNHDWYDYRSPSGASLERAVEFIGPYAAGQQAQIEFLHSKVKFDGKRAAAGQREFIPHAWNVCEAAPVYVEASCVDPQAGGRAVDLPCGARHERFVSWESVVNFARNPR